MNGNPEPIDNSPGSKKGIAEQSIARGINLAEFIAVHQLTRKQTY